ncbi:MAG: trypsin-like peptidase domain-containing protein [Flavobacteriales bacterium]|nr:trypsin-like peptidase domain-containing protein [Flavobacteriales bacterium]
MNKLRALFLILATASMSVAVAQPSATLVNQIQKSIVRVESGGKIGTGFLWKQRNWIVTTLHLIGDHRTVKITLHDGVRTARVRKVLKAHDLVLLEMDREASASSPILSTVNGSPALHSDLYTIGYNGDGNLNNIIDRSLRLGFSRNNKLEGLLSASLKTALNQCKSPDPAIDILYLDGTLLPGFSGSPIVDLSGKLVGIADGGLDRGASSISWGIPASRINDLERSLEPAQSATSCGSGNTATFSADYVIEEDEWEVVNYEDFRFVKTKTRTIEEMWQTVDDPTTLVQLVNTFSAHTLSNYAQFRYDIYEDLYSGAVICVPEGMHLETVENGLLVGEFAAQNMAFVVWAQKVTSTNPDLLAKFSPNADLFQALIVQLDGGTLSYEQDMTYSYTEPVILWGGTAAHRMAYTGYQSYYDQWGMAQVQPITYSFQTLMGRDDTFIGAAALDQNNTNDYKLALQTCVSYGQCNQSGVHNECTLTCERYTLFTQLLLGAHMTGFSNNYNPNQW